MKLIFLDIDGVLNTRRFVFEHEDYSKFTWPNDHLNPVNVAVLDKVIKETGANIVLSSAWRQFIGLKDLMKIIRTKGYTGPDFIGVTPKLISSDFSNPTPRGKEIQKWLDYNIKQLETFVILDDIRNMEHLNHKLVWINPNEGLIENSRRDYIGQILKQLE